MGRRGAEGGKPLIISTAAAHPGQPLVLARSHPIELGPIDTSPRTARASAVAQLAQWDRGHLADDVQEVVSELVTNACAASEESGTAVSVRLVLTSASVVVQVLDSAPGVPLRREPDPAAESGRGLALVHALTGGRWGWRVSQGGAKLVWAEIPA
jgi:signal transduction histidine kinase